jgi:hypothetical protein
MHYEGDERFSQMLAEISFPRPLREIKAFLRGALAASNLVMPSAIFETLTEGKELEFDSKEQAEAYYSNFIGLWNILAGEQQGEHGHLLSQETYPCTVSGLIQRIEDREAEVMAFVRGVDVGGTDPDEMTSDGQDASQSLSEGTAFLEQLLHRMGKGPIEMKELSGISETLDDLDQVISDCMSRIIVSLEETRAGHAQSLSEEAIKPLSKIGRNDPCPCGSGKKFKKCCLH